MASKTQILGAVTAGATKSNDTIKKLQDANTALMAENASLKTQLSTSLTLADSDEILAAIPGIFG